MLTASQFADKVGRQRMADEVGVLATAVSNAVVRGRFPSSWFVVCKALAASEGIPCPPDLFGMKSHSRKRGDAPAPIQGSGSPDQRGDAA